MQDGGQIIDGAIIAGPKLVRGLPPRLNYPFAPPGPTASEGSRHLYDCGGAWPSGKARDFGSRIRRFESFRPNQFQWRMSAEPAARSAEEPSEGGCLR